MLRALLSIVLLLSSVLAFGWGHLDFVGGDWGQSTLTYALVNRGKIKYCVHSDEPKRFPEANISQQTRAALSVWIKAAGKYSRTSIEAVDCKDGQPDLMVQVGPESDFTEMSGYHVPQMDGERFYSLVKLNSEYTYIEEKHRYQVVDFAQMLPAALSPSKVIDEISQEKPMTVGDFSGHFKVHYQKAYLSSYKMLLHEIGHAFGLCDTENNLFKYCDVKYRTGTRPPAVMNQADFFYLTPDDKAGLAALIQRYEISKKP